MLKKRLIFTLLYNDGYFMLSRNFRLQKVGDFNWLQKNYDFSHISFSIDELIVLDVTRGKKKSDEFCNTLKKLTQGCFVPITAGGGIDNVETARSLLRSGADKVAINSILYENENIIEQLANEFGQQCIVASIDIKKSPNDSYQTWSQNGNKQQPESAAYWIETIAKYPIGELYLNSIDRDGTGQGYDLELLDLLPNHMSKPIILAGGAGNAKHLATGLTETRVDAVATAHLFNFIGDGLKKARHSLISDGIALPFWDTNERFLKEYTENTTNQ